MDCRRLRKAPVASQQESRQNPTAGCPRGETAGIRVLGAKNADLSLPLSLLGRVPLILI